MEKKAASSYNLHVPVVTETIQERSNDHFKRVQLDLHMNPVCLFDHSRRDAIARKHVVNSRYD